MCSYHSKRGVGDEAQVRRARGWMFGLWLELLTQLVKVKLLLPETQSLTVSLQMQR